MNANDFSQVCDGAAFGGGGVAIASAGISLGLSLGFVQLMEFIAETTTVALKNIADKEDEKVEAAVITDTSQSSAIYYGADIRGRIWKTTTPPMTFDVAVAWAYSQAATNTYGKGASWGLYTQSADDAYDIAVILCGPIPIAHFGRPGEYSHYHPMMYLFADKYKHFHIWFGSIN